VFGVLKEMILAFQMSGIQEILALKAFRRQNYRQIKKSINKGGEFIPDLLSG
jgi:hypothetical protein